MSEYLWLKGPVVLLFRLTILLILDRLSEALIAQATCEYSDLYMFVWAFQTRVQNV